MKQSHEVRAFDRKGGPHPSEQGLTYHLTTAFLIITIIWHLFAHLTKQQGFNAVKVREFEFYMSISTG